MARADSLPCQPRALGRRAVPSRHSHAPPRRAIAVQKETTLQDANQSMREGDFERRFVQMQANKPEREQESILTYLAPHKSTAAVDVCVVGCGPAGLALSGELAKRGLRVCLVGPDSKFTNNYGVWLDEFRNLGMEHLLDHVWEDTICYFMDKKMNLGRAYGRVDRSGLRHHLLEQCRRNGVTYVPELVTTCTARPDAQESHVRTASGRTIAARLVNISGGAVSAKFIHFEKDAPPVAAQTAYGIVARLRGYDDVYDPSTMLFMDYRRAHSGMWSGTGFVLGKDAARGEVTHPNWDANLGTCSEAPSFLYAMPLSDGTVFLEETCLVARPPLPFSALKRRLFRRVAAMGVDIVEVVDEEHSYIPVGGPMPCSDQTFTAFGAAANLVHPATGYSVTRMLEETVPFADAIAEIIQDRQSAAECAERVWEALWPVEKRRQAAFHIFGMELLATLEVQSIHDFFEAFFKMPDRFWRGFLASKLSSQELMVFALLMFVLSNNSIRLKLMGHLLSSRAGRYLVSKYL